MRGCLKQPQRELRATLGRDQADMAAVAAQKLLEEPRHWPAQPLGAAGEAAGCAREG